MMALAGCRPAGDAGGGRHASDVAGEPVNPPLVVGTDTLPPALVQAALVRQLGFTSRGGRVFCAYTPLGQDGGRLFVWWLCQEQIRGPDSIETGSGSGGPAVLEADTTSDPPRIARIRVPRDGAAWSRDIDAMFPRDVVRRIHAPTESLSRRGRRLSAETRRAAAAFYGSGA